MKSYFNAVKWEIILDFKEYARYRVGLLMDFIVFTGTFIMIYYLGVNKGFEAFYGINETGGKMLVLIGYIFWQNASSALGYSTGTITNETAQGIFEMRLQGKFSMEGIIFFRLLTSCVIHLITYAGIIAFGTVMAGFQGKDFIFIFISILVSIPSLVGMYGIGLVFGSICVCEKSVGSLILIVQTILLFVTNTLSPSRNDIIYLIPFTCGIDIMRSLYLGNAISFSIPLIYIAVNVLWLFIGIFFFRIALSHERRYGSFDNY